MLLFFVTLEDGEQFVRAMSKLKENDMNGTVIPSTSLKHALMSSKEEEPIFGKLSKLFQPEYEMSHTLIMVIHDDKLEAAKQIVRDITHGLGRKKGIMFALPITFWEGID